MGGLIRDFLKNESGMETIEWVLVGVLVVLGFVAIWVGFGPKFEAIYNDMKAELDAARGVGT